MSGNWTRDMANSTWTASQWTSALFLALVAYGWGIPNATISIRDADFLSSFWRAIFQVSQTAFPTSIADLSQTEGQSERTNQTIEIAPSHYKITTGADWINMRLQTSLIRLQLIVPNLSL